MRHVEHRPIAFVVTRFAAGEETLVPGAAWANWQQLAAARRAGVVIGAHARAHRSLPGCGDAELADQLAGAWHELGEAKLEPEPVVAYPYGHHDARVRRAAIGRRLPPRVHDARRAQRGRNRSVATSAASRSTAATAFSRSAGRS